MNLCEIVLRWMSLNLTGVRSIWVQEMTAAPHYLSWCWPSFTSLYGVIRPQWVNSGWMSLTKHSRVALCGGKYEHFGKHLMCYYGISLRIKQMTPIYVITCVNPFPKNMFSGGLGILDGFLIIVATLTSYIIHYCRSHVPFKLKLYWLALFIIILDISILWTCDINKR